jgi:Transposase DDE domain
LVEDETEQDDDSRPVVARLDEDWQIVERALPAGWQAKARELGALRRTRGIKDASHLLRVMLIHLADGCGLRETAVRAKLAGLAEISDVAILKRLNGCGAWFEWMIRGIQRQLMETTTPPLLAGYRLPIVDRTMVINPGDILVADRGYAHPPGIAHVVDAGGGVIIRANLVTMALVQRDGSAFDILANLRTLDVAETGDWMVAVKAGKRLIRGRLCAIKKSAAAAKKGQARAVRESQRGGHSQLQPQTLEAATYVFVFTTLGGDYAAARVLELYRARWQIELTFKRLKSLVSLGHLKKHDDTAARAWLQGKLLVAFLIDRLLAMAERVSPWGYLFEEGQTQPLRVAGNRAHA